MLKFTFMSYDQKNVYKKYKKVYKLIKLFKLCQFR